MHHFFQLSSCILCTNAPQDSRPIPPRQTTSSSFFHAEITHVRLHRTYRSLCNGLTNSSPCPILSCRYVALILVLHRCLSAPTRPPTRHASFSLACATYRTARAYQPRKHTRHHPGVPCMSNLPYRTSINVPYTIAIFSLYSLLSEAYTYPTNFSLSVL